MLLDDIFNLHQSLSVVKNLHQYGFWMIFSWFLLVFLHLLVIIDFWMSAYGFG